MLRYAEEPSRPYTIESGVSQRKPTLRNMRFAVAQLLKLVAADITTGEVTADHPYLAEAAIRAALLYAAHIANPRTIITLFLAF